MESDAAMSQSDQQVLITENAGKRIAWLLEQEQPPVADSNFPPTVHVPLAPEPERRVELTPDESVTVEVDLEPAGAALLLMDSGVDGVTLASSTLETSAGAGA